MIHHELLDDLSWKQIAPNGSGLGIAARGGGAYRLDEDGTATLIATADRPSAIAFDPTDGDLFIAWDLPSDVYRVAGGTPVAGRGELWVDNFGGGGDDDPIGMAYVPASYMGAVASPGDFVITDYGAGSADRIWRFSASTPGGESLLHSDDGTLVDGRDVAVLGMSSTSWNRRGSSSSMGCGLPKKARSTF